jgi:cytochrome c5
VILIAIVWLALLGADARRHRPQAVAAHALPAAVRPYVGVFPEGEGQAVAERACMLCHSASLTTQQAKDSTGWAKTLTTMQKWGAPLSTAERDTLQRWFTAQWGPRSH